MVHLLSVKKKRDSTARTVSTQPLFSVGTQRKPGTQGPGEEGPREVMLTQDRVTRLGLNAQGVGDLPLPNGRGSREKK